MDARSGVWACGTGLPIEAFWLVPGILAVVGSCTTVSCWSSTCVTCRIAGLSLAKEGGETCKTSGAGRQLYRQRAAHPRTGEVATASSNRSITLRYLSGSDEHIETTSAPLLFRNALAPPQRQHGSSKLPDGMHHAKVSEHVASVWSVKRGCRQAAWWGLADTPSRDSIYHADALRGSIVCVLGLAIMLVDLVSRRWSLCWACPSARGLGILQYSKITVLFL